jgi:hypothetical protein
MIGEIEGGEAPVRGTAGISGSAERAGQETNGRSIERSNTMAGGNLAVIESEREAAPVATPWAGLGHQRQFAGDDRPTRKSWTILRQTRNLLRF